MFGLKNILNKNVELRQTVVIYQTVRWRSRKPFWLGVAKSKMFLPPPPPKLPPEEELEMKNLTHRYNNQVNSLLHFIKYENEHYQEKLKEDRTSLFDMEITESIKANEVWNSESARLRDIRVKNELEKQKLEALQEISNKKLKQKKIMERLNEMVRVEKERSQSFVTYDNLDEAIEHCLNNVVDYNFAIDVMGKKYPGKNPIIFSNPELHKDKEELT